VSVSVPLCVPEWPVVENNVEYNKCFSQEEDSRKMVHSALTCAGSSLSRYISPFHIHNTRNGIVSTINT
jgi:hypothetical protein